MKPPTKDGAPARPTIVFNAQWLVDRATGDTFWNDERVGTIAFGNHGIALEELLSACNSHAALVAVVSQHIHERLPGELALGFARYEALRRLNPRQYRELHDRNMKGENFDGMVDALVMANEKLTQDARP